MHVSTKIDVKYIVDLLLVSRAGSISVGLPATSEMKVCSDCLPQSCAISDKQIRQCQERLLAESCTDSA